MTGAVHQVRFTRGRGIAAYLERAQENHPGWRHGQVRCDSTGVQLKAGRRKLRFIPASALSNVYRQGEGVRVEFKDNGRRLAVEFWAAGAQQAAQIVETMPTLQTVEADLPLGQAKLPRRRDLWLFFILLPIVVFVVLKAALHGPRSRLAGPNPSSTPLAPTASAAPLQQAEFTSAERLQMRADMDSYYRTATPLIEGFAVKFDGLQRRTVPSAYFDQVATNTLLPGWEHLQRELNAHRPREGAGLMQLNALLSCSAAARAGALSTYAYTSDPQRVLRSFTILATAEACEAQAQELVSR